ncbi:Adenosylcobinamide-GDP ribazoletransferase [subsurface metagenome]
MRWLLLKRLAYRGKRKQISLKESKLRSLLAAFCFLTILPLGTALEERDESLASSMTFFPLVGISMGGFLFLVHKTSSILFSPPLVNMLVLLGWVLITGALHLDGFMDTIDGLSGGKTKEERLKIMKDPSAGAKGIIGLLVLLGLKFLLLLEIEPSLKMGTLLLAPAVGRWSMVLAVYLAPYARMEGLGKAFITHKDRETVFWTSLTAGILGLVIFKSSFLYIIGVCLGIVYLSTLYFKSRIGGITGDTLGALNEIIELIALFSICCLAKAGAF